MECVVIKHFLTIFIIADTYYPNISGVANFVKRLSLGLAKKKHHVYLFTPNYKKGKTHLENKIYKNGFLKIYRLKSYSLPGQSKLRICLNWQIKKEINIFYEILRPDIVHVQYHYLLGKIFIKEAKKRKIKTVATNHFLPENLESYLYIPFFLKSIIFRKIWKDMRKLYSIVDVITAPTKLAIEKIYKEIKINKKIIPVSNGVDLSYFRFSSDKKEKLFNNSSKNTDCSVLFVGRLVKEKKIDILIKAIYKIRNTIDNVTLKIIGTGIEYKNLNNLVKKLDLSSKVSFLGLIKKNMLKVIYKKCSLFCMPGIAELQSIATLEAMSSASPIILANAVALPHLIYKNKNGFLFEANNVEDLSLKLINFFSLSNKKRFNMGLYSQTIAKKHENSKSINIFENLYYKL